MMSQRLDVPHHYPQKQQKIVVIMGPTGSGKSQLSVDLAARFFPAEVINSDKIQMYRGLDIITNKIPMSQRLGVPHHLLDELHPSDHPELTPSEFRSVAASAISDIASSQKLPLVVGGSNSFIYALVVNRYDPKSDVFHESCPDPVCTELRYDCCFLWLDVSMPVLNQYLSKRVDDMLELGMFDELAEYFNSGECPQSNSETRTGIGKAIGVPEFETYFRMFPRRTDLTSPEERVAFEEAVKAMKENTWQLAKRQVEKIQRLRSAGWNVRRLEATEVVMAAMGLGGSDSSNKSDIWKRQVLEPSVEIVKQFLEE